ncbi:MAG: hypothetical protein JNJ61_29155 [Anaerolineae bacterium]|nr:hypothetical protein [Anaerolineae bacterium]
MILLQRIKARPSLDDLSPGEARFVQAHFDPYAGEVLIDGEAIGWNEINEVEVVTSPRSAGPAGWLVRYLVHRDERYHIGIYFGRQEAVLPNVTLNVARYVVQCVAYFAPLPVRYKGPEGLSPLAQE